MKLGRAEVCRRWPTETAKAFGASLRNMPGLTLAFIRVRQPDFVHLVLDRERHSGGAGSSRWLAPVLMHNQTIAEQLVGVFHCSSGLHGGGHQHIIIG